MSKYFIICVLIVISPLISNEGNLIPSYTTTSKPEKMKIKFGLNNKEYNHYYHEDGTSLSIDNLDCGSDGKCEFNYIDDNSYKNNI